MTSRSARNHNPGNIRYGPFTERRGATKDEANYSVFETDAKGLATLLELIASPNYINLTIYNFFMKYAPATDSNQPVKYGKFVSSKIGVSTSIPVKQLDPYQLLVMASAITAYEGWKRDKIKPEKGEQGIMKKLLGKIFLVMFCMLSPWLICGPSAFAQGPYLTCDCTPSVDAVAKFQLQFDALSWIDTATFDSCGTDPATRVLCVSPQKTICFDLFVEPVGAHSVKARAVNLWGPSTDSAPLSFTKSVPSGLTTTRIVK